MRPTRHTGPRAFEILKTAIFRSPTKFFCESCDKYIPSTMPWACGHCGAVHAEVRLYSFLNKCRSCKRRPDGIECPHCKTVWAFSRTAEVRRVARGAPAAETSEVIAEGRKREHTEKKEELVRKRELADLEQKLKEVEEKNVPGHKRAFQKEQESVFEDFYRRFGKDVAIDKLRKQIQEEYKDSDRLERMLECLKDVEESRA